jgi:uncharacterized protein (TIGR03435 family)
MKRLPLFAVSLALLIPTSPHAQTSAQTSAQTNAQSIVGTWQGTLTTGANNPRIAITLQKKADGPLHGGLKWIDSDFGFAFSSVNFSPPEVTLAQDMSNMTFRGQLSADGKSIAGTLTQGKQSFPLTLSLATSDTLWRPTGPAPMPANADPSYDVATIKPASPEEIHPVFDPQAPEFRATGTSAGELIKIVYKIRGRQIINMPPWVADSKFDIVAKPDTPGVPSEDQTRVMVRKLLTERFHLVCHTGTQDFPALVMTLNSKGPAPKPSDPDFNGHNGGFLKQDGGDFLLQLSGITMPQFLKTLMDRYRDKQIVDETGLTGIYDITLRLPVAALQGIGDGGAEDEVGSDYIGAAEKAGFKFTSKKTPLPVVVIDHIDPPTPN